LWNPVFASGFQKTFSTIFTCLSTGKLANLEFPSIFNMTDERQKIAKKLHFFEKYFLIMNL
jgi:hypothetical protein